MYILSRFCTLLLNTVLPMKNSDLFKDPQPANPPDDSYARAIKVDPRARPLGRPRPNGLSYGQCWLREPEMGACERAWQEHLAAAERLTGVR